MPTKEARKEAIRQFKEQKPDAGIYAVRCTVTGRLWVGATKNLDATKNRVWFCLRNGLSLDKPPQDEWDANGELAFQYEIVDRFDKDLHPLEVDELLKKKLAHWATKLGATLLR
ncbi:MAG TPA: GIY-YIG nuclease family protein [Terracidiphilus sp.]|nr:GIY-YIG nuclease family protein [Terracidiphilus sp.]